MWIEQSVKEFSFISYFFFSSDLCDRCASAPLRRLLFYHTNAPKAPKFSPSTTIVFISASLQLKAEGDLHREDRGGMMMGLSIGLRGVTWWQWWWCIGVSWLHDDVSSSLDGSLSLHDYAHLSGYCIPSLIRKFGQFYSNVYKGILDGVEWLLNKLDKPFFIGGRWRQTVHGVDAPIKIYLLSWRRTFLVTVFFASTFFASSFSLLFSATCLHCAILAVARYIPEVKSRFLLVVVSSFSSLPSFA